MVTVAASSSSAVVGPGLTLFVASSFLHTAFHVIRHFSRLLIISCLADPEKGMVVDKNAFCDRLMWGAAVLQQDPRLLYPSTNAHTQLRKHRRSGSTGPFIDQMPRALAESRHCGACCVPNRRARRSVAARALIIGSSSFQSWSLAT